MTKKKPSSVDQKPAKKPSYNASKKPSYNASKKHAVSLTFLLDEKISPQELAQKLANRCGGYELMPGEGILVEHAKIACVVIDETLSLPHFSWQWYGSLKEPKRLKEP